VFFNFFAVFFHGNSSSPFDRKRGTCGAIFDHLQTWKKEKILFEEVNFQELASISNITEQIVL
jgi:hypothetical protein